MKPKYIFAYVLVLLLVIPLLIKVISSVSEEKNERVLKLKNGEIAPIAWNQDVIEEIPNIKFIKLKVESNDTILKDMGINLTDYFYYIPYSKEVFYGIWYSKENELAIKDGDNFTIKAKNKDNKEFGGLAILAEVGTQGIFEISSIKPVESVNEIEHLSLSLDPRTKNENGSKELESPIEIEIHLKVIKEGTIDDFPEL